jgi:hypothetical protein
LWAYQPTKLITTLARERPESQLQSYWEAGRAIVA